MDTHSLALLPFRKLLHRETAGCIGFLTLADDLLFQHCKGVQKGIPLSDTEPLSASCQQYPTVYLTKMTTRTLKRVEWLLQRMPERLKAARRTTPGSP